MEKKKTLITHILSKQQLLRDSAIFIYTQFCLGRSVKVVRKQQIVFFIWPKNLEFLIGPFLWGWIVVAFSFFFFFLLHKQMKKILYKGPVFFVSEMNRKNNNLLSFFFKKKHVLSTSFYFHLSKQ